MVEVWNVRHRPLAEKSQCGSEINAPNVKHGHCEVMTMCIQQLAELEPWASRWT